MYRALDKSMFAAHDFKAVDLDSHGFFIFMLNFCVRREVMTSFSSELFGCWDIAQTYAHQQQHDFVTPWHLLYGMAKNPNLKSYVQLSQKISDIESQLKKCPKVHQSDQDVIKPDAALVRWLQAAGAFATQNRATAMSEEHILQTMPKKQRDIACDLDALSAEKSSAELDFLVNLNELSRAGKIDPVIGRQQEIRSVLEVLSRKSKNNPMLLGDAGVGKTA